MQYEVTLPYIMCEVSLHSLSREIWTSSCIICCIGHTQNEKNNVGEYLFLI